MAALLLLSCLFPGNLRAADDTLAIALDKSLPGKYGYRTCDIFARSLYKNLTRAGGEAYYIVYNWKSMDAGWLCHAIVVYRDSNNQYLGMDQSRHMPVLLPGKSPAEWIQWFNGPGEVQLLRSQTKKKLQGNYASLDPHSDKTAGKVGAASATREQQDSSFHSVRR